MTTERRSRTTPSADAQSSSGALTGYEAELWRMADALRGSMDAADYKHVVLGLIFLKYISDAFQELRLNWICQGQPLGRCKVRQRAERVSRPAREKKRRRRVLVVITCSPRPMRTVHRARLWAIIWTASQAALAAKRPEGRWLRPTRCLRSRMAFSISAWRRWSVSSSSVSPSRSVMKA